MPFTVITLKNTTSYLRGDLTKWMQEIAVGVYVGNFNSRVREELWERVKQNVGRGEATLAYSSNNELGYLFDMHNCQREPVEFDGITLVRLPETVTKQSISKTKNFSNAAKFHRARKFSQRKSQFEKTISPLNYVVIDIETTGLDELSCEIVEIAAIKKLGNQVTSFHKMIKGDYQVPKNIEELTGISNALLSEQGADFLESLTEFVDFVGVLPIVGYGVGFDIRVINSKLNKFGQKSLLNQTYDLIRYVKKEKKYLPNYQLETVLQHYEIAEKVPHRALQDAELILELSTKVKKFVSLFKVR